MAYHVWLFFAALTATVLAGVPPPAHTAAYPHRGPPDHILNVHVIAHTHDDPGWLQTVDGYYETSVRSILTTVVKSLAADKNRRFTYVEIAFFSKWWAEQDAATRALVRRLVAERRLEFAVGGWCMPDEATTTYTDLIDEMSAGHLWLQRELGDAARPTAGWQIDPFGHSAGWAWLSAQLGFNSTVVNRIDRHDLEDRRARGALDFAWEPFRSDGTRVLTTAMYSHYNWPAGRHVDGATVRYDAREFADQMYGINGASATPELLVTFGDDFQYVNAEPEFAAIDALIAHFAAHPEAKINLFYSTPASYAAAVASRLAQPGQAPLTVKKDDFWPYADSFDVYWSGYYTSHPAFKRSVRASSALFHAARAAHALSSADEAGARELQAPWYAIGVAQHHDAITGTSKAFVYDDYLAQLKAGDTASAKAVAGAISAGDFDAGWRVCSATSADAEGAFSCSEVVSDSAMLAVYNPVAWRRNAVVSMHTKVSGLCALSANGTKLKSQSHELDAGFDFSFLAESLPPFGAATYRLEPCAAGRSAGAKRQSGSYLTIENERFVVTFQDAKLTEVLDKHQRLATKLSSEVLFYVPENTPSDPRSGAYVFASNTPPEAFDDSSRSAAKYSGELYEEVEVSVNKKSGITQRYRLARGEDVIRVTTSIGPISVSDNRGKEVVVRLTAESLATSGLLYTDTHSLEFVAHERGKIAGQWPVDNEISGNFYPVSTSAYITDRETALAIVTDRAQGVASLRNGSIEVMIHRRLLTDGDHKGVGEALNDATSISTQHLVSIGDNANVARTVRRASLLHEHPVVVLVADDPAKAKAVEWSPLRTELPKNVHLTTLQAQDGSAQTILRLSHIFAVGEDAELSAPAVVDLATLFSDWKIDTAQETTLSANAKIGSMMSADLRVKLFPMQIRTFLVTLSRQ